MLRRTFAAALLPTVWLAGCATGNVETGYNLSTTQGKGLAVFSVTHDFAPPMTASAPPGGGSARIHFYIRNAITGKDDFRVASLTDSLTESATTPFDSVWGRYYVRELPAGRYEVYSWEITISTAGVVRTLSPKKPPPPLTFEVQAGKAVYIGNLHGNIRYGNVLGAAAAQAGFPSVDNEADRDLKLIFKEYPQLAGKVVTHPLPATPVWVLL